MRKWTRLLIALPLVLTGCPALLSDWELAEGESRDAAADRAGGADDGGAGGSRPGVGGGPAGAGSNGTSSAGGTRSTGGIGPSGGAAASGGLVGTGGAAQCAIGQKLCAGGCAVPNPTAGCHPTLCDAPCPAPPENGFARCTAETCDFGCFIGYQRSGDGGSCVLRGGSGGTTSTGGAGTTGGANTCASNTDCADAICEAGACVSCFDGKKNNGETGVDCGGTRCATKCASGKSCGANSDCTSGICCTLFPTPSSFCSGRPSYTCW